MANLKCVLVSLCLILSSRPSHAQFEDLQECISGDFMPQFVGCVISSAFSGIQNVIDNDSDVTQQNGDGHASGRKLLSLEHGTMSRDLNVVPRKMMINMKLKDMGVTAASLVDDLQNFAVKWRLGNKDDSFLKRLSGMQIKSAFQEAFKKTPEFQDVVKEMLTIRASVNMANETVPSPCDDLGFPDQECENLRTKQACLQQYDEAAFEDGLDWISCLFVCDNLEPMTYCTANLFNPDAGGSEPCGRVSWFNDVLLAIINSLLNQSHCLFKVMPSVSNDAITVTEGGEAGEVSFMTYVPPEVMCVGQDPLGDDIMSLGLVVVSKVFGFPYTCSVQMHVTTANWLDDVAGAPQCYHPKRALHQLALGFHPAASNNSGIFNITSANWNGTFNIPLLPVVDHRVDGDVNVSVTFKLNVQGSLTGDTIKVPVLVEDADNMARKPVECSSINDPHLVTFDGHPYNNFYQGAFYLYQHNILPYEVQVIYQPCQTGNNNASCNCAVAVRSGDDVFVVDRCRRKCSNGVCDPEQLVILYVNGELTPGTRLFNMNGGLRHDVVLPHGTIVKIITNNDLLNVWITPGSYDQDETKGLCGVFNTNADDDLTMPNGTVYTGPGAGDYEHPKAFSEAWRVPDDELLFYGALPSAEEFSPLNACTCRHLLSGTDCQCGRGSVTEICDLFMTGEYNSTTISSITRPSNHTESNTFLNNIDLDLTYDPLPVTSFEFRNGWNDTKARDFCADLLSSSDNSIIQTCLRVTLPGVRDVHTVYTDAIEFCVQDIKIMGNTDWQHSTLDNAKFNCLNKVVRRNTILDVGSMSDAPDNLCVNDCHGNNCSNGICVCDDGNWGPDCSFPATASPKLTPKNQNTELCDSRKQMCSYASVLGQHFSSNQSLVCKVMNVEISSSGVEFLPKRKTEVWEKFMGIISPNQAVCELPKNGSYQVTMLWYGEQVHMEEDITQYHAIELETKRLKRDLDVVVMEESVGLTEVTFIYIAHDSMCFECSSGSQSCSRKETSDYCWISDTCWGPGEVKPDDPCRHCDPEVSTDSWTVISSEVCEDQKEQEDVDAEEEKSNMILRACLGGCISAAIVIVVLIIFCVTRNKDRKNRLHEEEKMNNPQPGSNNFYNVSDATYDNPAMSSYHDDEDEVFRPTSIAGSSMTSMPPKLLTRVEVLKSEELDESLGRNSLASYSSIKLSDPVEYTTVKTQF